MPEIEITPEQEDRLRALQEDIAQDVVGKYGHVRPCDAVEYLLDRYEEDEDADAAATADAETPDDSSPTGESNGATANAVDEDDDANRTVDDEGGDDAMLNEMMSLLDTHDDKWGESSGDERYAVELPDDTTEHVRTKDDVKALLFKHYR
ncbi:hypothetical protein [Haloplanus salilacus]|uniref:hypothetical protein n=1 Tax=Haloplanus salilacus TaxID=2949994 RepID=UPI003CCDE7F7